MSWGSTSAVRIVGERFMIAAACEPIYIPHNCHFRLPNFNVGAQGSLTSTPACRVMSTELSQVANGTAGISRTPHKTKKRKHVERDDASPTKKRKRVLVAKPGIPTHAERLRLKTKPKQKGRPEADSPVLVASVDVYSPPSDIELQDASTPAQPNPPDRARPNGHVDFESIDITRKDSISLERPTTSKPSANSSLSSFASVRLSIYVALPAISISKSFALSSLLTEHISPLLLTYYAPVKGVVLAFSDPVLTCWRPSQEAPPHPQLEEEGNRETLARCADDYGVSYVWLTLTLLLFHPERGQRLEGWINVCSEGFIGLVSYNYFQAGVGKARKPADWTWNEPGLEQGHRRKKKPKRERLRTDESEAEMDQALQDVPADLESPWITASGQHPGAEAKVEREIGFFSNSSDVKIRGTVSYRVVDTEIVPGYDREKWSLQIDGTFLSQEEEERVLEEERTRAERLRGMRPDNGSRSASVLIS